MDFIDYYLYEVTSSNIYEDYVIVPKRYKFKNFDQKIAKLQDYIKTDFSENNVDTFTKVGKIIEVVPILEYFYNIKNNGNIFELKYKNILNILLIKTRSGKIKYFEAYKYTNKIDYNKDNKKITFLNGNIYNNADIYKGYYQFYIDKIKLTPTFEGYVKDYSNIRKGFSFEGVIAIPFNSEKYLNDINCMYSADKEYVDIKYIDFYNEDYNIKVKNVMLNESQIYPYHEKYKNKAKELLNSYLKDYFNNIKKEKQITFNNINKFMKER